MKKIILFLFVLLTHNYTYAQDTFSIVAVDKETGEIGAAGATCIKGCLLYTSPSPRDCQ